MTGLEAIKKKLKTDPNYSKEDAVREWVKLNPDEAVELAQQIWPDFGSKSKYYPMDYASFEDYLYGINPFDVVMEGYYSASNHFDPNDSYFQMDGDGHYTSMNEAQYEDACKEFMYYNGHRYILENADYLDLPDELEAIVDWNEESKNLRPRSGSKTRAKSPARKQPSKSSNAKSRNAKSPNTKSRNAKRASGSRR